MRSQFDDEGAFIEFFSRFHKPQTSKIKGVEKLTKISTRIIYEAYREERKKAGFAHRNWFRKEETLKDLKLKVLTNNLLYDDLSSSWK